MNVPHFLPDRPAQSDAFGRSHFARSLAKALQFVSGGEGLVVGIEGNWGSGKSTIIGFVKNELPLCCASEFPPVIVDFNPWMVSNSGALVDALITQIAAAISLSSNSPEKALNAGQKLLGYIGLLKHLKYLKYVPGVAFAGNIAQDIGSPRRRCRRRNQECGRCIERSKRASAGAGFIEKKGRSHRRVA